MIDLPVALIEPVQRGRVVLVAGLACSKLAGAPGWEELALRLADRIEDDERRMELKELVAVGRCPEAVAYLGTRLPRAAVAEVLAEAYPVVAAAPSSIAALVRVAWRGVITTGYDGLWAAALVDGAGGETYRVFAPDEAGPVAEHPGRFLWQLGGVSSVPESLTLCTVEARRLGPLGVGSTLRALARQWSFVFVGFRPGDPDLQLVARQLGEMPGAGPHFLLMPGMRALEAELVEAELGVTAVTAAGTLEDLLRELSLAAAPAAPGARPDPRDVEGWLAVWGRDPSNAEAAVMLARAEARLREQQNWPRLVELLLGRIERGRDRSERVAVLRGVARVYNGPLGAPDRAFTALITAFHLEPTTDGLLAEIEVAAAKVGRWAELTEVWAQAAAAEPDPARAAALLVQLGEAQAARLGDVDAAVATFERACAVGGAQAPATREALDALERLYRTRERWADVARVIDRKAKSARIPTPAEGAGGPRLEAPDPWPAARPDDAAALARSLETTLGHDPNNRAALQAMDELYERSGTGGAKHLDLLERLARLAPSDGERLPILRRLATRWEASPRPERLGRAAATLEQILAVTRGDQAAANALARIYRKARRWPALAIALRRQIEVTEDPLVRRELWADLGAVYETGLRDAARAADAYTSAVSLGDEREATLAAQARLAERTGRWFAMVEALDKLAFAARDRTMRADALLRSADIAERVLKDLVGAETRCARAMEIDPERLDALTMMARLCRGRGNPGRAAELLREAAARTAETADKVRLLRDLGALQEEQLGDRAEAERLYKLALEIDPDNGPCGERLALLYAKDERWEALEPVLAMLARKPDFRPTPAMVRGQGAVRAARGVWIEAAALYQTALDAYERTAPPDDEDVRATRAQLAHDLADLYREKLDDPGRAIAAYQASLALAPGRRQTLHRLIELGSAEKRWSEVSGAWLRLAELEDRPIPRAKCLLAAATIHRDQLADTDQAIALYNRALDQAPGLTQAFDAAQKLLADAGDWKALAQHYKQMIERLPAIGFSDMRLRLWTELGQLSLAHLGDVETAAAALETAAGLDGGNVKRREQLADVYLQAGPDHADKAIAEHQGLLAQNPYRLASYRALARLYADNGDADKLWCVAAALTFLHRTDPELLRFYEAHRSQELRAARRPFDDQVWRLVVHPDEDPLVSGVLARISQVAASVTAVPHVQSGLRRNDRVDVAADDRLAARALRYVTGLLGLRVPDLFFKDSEPQSLSLRNLHEDGVLAPALIVGKGIEQRASEQDLVFDMGKRLTLLAPERFARVAVPSAGALGVTLRTALALGGVPSADDRSDGGNGEGEASDDGALGRLASELRRLATKELIDDLSLVSRRLREAHGDVVDLGAWAAGTDLTAARVGLILSNDLAAAARVISSEPATTSPLHPKRRLKDLLVFSVSEGYFSVRRSLGLDVVQSQATPALHLPALPSAS